MFCTQCGAQNHPEAKFCSECGASTVVSVTHVIHLTSTTVNITNDISHVFFWCNNFHFHDRL